MAVLSAFAPAQVRTVAARLRREVTTAAVHAGLRAATGTTVPLALGYWTGRRGFVLAAVGGWLAAMADVGGVARTRLRTMGAYVVFGGLSYAAGAYTAGVGAGLRVAGHEPLAILLSAALVFCWAVGGGLLRALGDAGTTLGNLVAVTFIAALANPAARVGDALYAGAMLAGGGVWTTALALGVWRVRPYDAARHGVADAYRALAHFAAGIGAALPHDKPPADGPDVGARFTTLARVEHARVRAAIEAGRGTLLATRRGRLGAAPRADDVALLLDQADEVFLTLLTLAEAAEAAADGGADPEEAADVAALAAVVALGAESLVELAEAVVAGARAGRRPPTLARLEPAVVRLAQRLDAEGVPRALAHGAAGNAPNEWLETIPNVGPDAARGAAAGGASGRRGARRQAMRHAAALSEQLAEEVGRGAETAAFMASGGDDPLLAAARAWLGRARRSGGWARLRVGARRFAGEVDSPTVRHALRLGAATAGAHALGLGLHVARGPWVTVTTLLVLQPSAGMTLRRSVARVLGTVLGGVVAAVLAAALHDLRLIAVVVFPLAALAVALRAVHYGVFTFFLTPVFVLIAQPAPGDWALAAVRAGDTLLGGVVAVAASLVLWPTWERASMPGTLAAAVEAARTLAGLAARRAAANDVDSDAGPGGGVPDEAAVRGARRRAGLAATAAEEAFGRLVAEPRGRGARANATLALLARVRRVNSAASALGTFGGAPHGAGGARLAALGADVDAVLADAADAVRGRRAPGAVPGGLAALLTDSAAAPTHEVLHGARETAERRVPDVPAWGTLVRLARHALGVRAAAVRLAGPAGDDTRTDTRMLC